MSLEKPGIFLYNKTAKRTKLATQRIKETIKHRIFSYLLFTIYTPLFFLAYLLISVVGVFSSSFKKKCLAFYVRYYFKLYFSLKGITQYHVDTIPKAFKRPSLILMPRYDNYSSLFVYSFFKSPLIIPLIPEMSKFRDNMFLPFSFVGKAFKHISYPDQNLDVCHKRVEDLIKAGHTVLMHVNQDLANSALSGRLHLSASLKTVLEFDTDIYFLRLRGWEHHNMTSFFAPTIVNSNMLRDDVALEHVPKDHLADRVAEMAIFYDFNQVHMEQE